MGSIDRQGIAFIILLLICMGCAKKPSFGSMEWSPFYWESDTISGIYIEKAFLYVPVKIEDLPHDFTMQLDLGTSSTVFYKKTIDSYLEAYTSLANKYKFPEFYDVNLKIGPVEFNGIDIGLFNIGEKIPKDSLHSGAPIHIGTIGADVFHDKILVIDYKSCQFAIIDSIPAAYSDLPAEEFELENGLMKLLFHINGEEHKLLFDTGMSPFQLVASKENALQIVDPLITDSVSGPYWWGTQITLYGLQVNIPVEFGGKVFTSSKVYYEKDKVWDNVFDAMNIWGITGNSYFFDNTLIIDYKNKLLRVK